jgi:uncharacterized membrane protein
MQITFYNMRRIVVILILGLILSNCSIEKRHHTKGYHVEWNNKHTIAKNNEVKDNEVERPKLVSKTIVKTEKLDFNNEEKSSKEIVIASNNGEESIEKKGVSNNFIIRLIEAQKLSKLFTDDPQYYPEGKEKTDVNAMLSLAFAISGIFFLPIIGSVLAFVFGIISLNKISKSTVLLKGKGMAIAGIIIGVLALLLWGLLIWILTTTWYI